MSGDDWLSYDERMANRLGFDSVLSFGKYKGKSVKEILEINPGYIKWIKDKGIYKCRPELNDELKERYEF